MEKILTVANMNCAHCEGKIDKGLNEISGVKASVNLADKTVTVQSDLTDNQLIDAIEKIGYKVSEIKWTNYSIIES